MALSACGSKLYTPYNLFSDTHFRFQNYIRWKEYKTASIYLQKQSNQKINDEYLEALKKYNITNYEDQGCVPDVTGDIINCTDLIKYHHVDSASIKTLRYNQKWVFNADSKVWLLESGLPDFYANSNKQSK